MTEHYLSEDGKKRLVLLLQKTMEAEGVGSLRDFCALISERSGLDMKFNRMFRLMKGHFDDASVTLLLPLVKARILKHPDGRFYTFDDIVAVLIGELDPESEPQQRKIKNGNS